MNALLETKKFLEIWNERMGFLNFLMDRFSLIAL